MKCIVCGKDEIFLDYLCRKDYLKKHPIFTKVPKTIKFNQCKESGIYFKLSIKDHSIKEFLRKLLVKEIEYDKRKFLIKKIELDVNYQIKANFRGTIDDKSVSFPFTFDMNIKESIDPEIAGRHDNYFQGMLQIRWEKHSKEEIKEITKYIGKFILQNKASIANMAYLKNGVDFLISSNQVIKECAYAVKKKYGGEVKVNAKLFSKDHQTSKDIYRVTALVRLPNFTIGDVIASERKNIFIKSIVGHEVGGLDLDTHKSTMMPYQNETYTVIDKEDIMPTSVSLISPHLEVVDPWDFQSKKVANHTPLAIGQKVKVAKIKKKLYLVKY